MRLIYKILAGILGCVLLALAVLYGASEWKLRRVYTVPPSTFVVNAAASASRGERLVLIRGCKDCHGAHLEGRSVPALPLFSLTMPNIARMARESTDGRLDLAIRHGLRADGTSLLVMPSSSFYFIDDADLSDIIAYLRSVPPINNQLPATTLGPIGRFMILNGTAPLSAAGTYHTLPRYPAQSATDPYAQGSYLAHSICTECHGLDLRGGKGGDPTDPVVPPSLVIVGAYSREAFLKLLNTGIGLGARKLSPLMTHVGQSRTPHLTDTELSALYAYLQHFAATASR